MNGWHKCHLCDCEFYDPSFDGYWDWCPDCLKAMEKQRAREAEPMERGFVPSVPLTRRSFSEGGSRPSHSTQLPNQQGEIK